MPIVYRIHPAIGIARVGDHPKSFYIGPELSCSPQIAGSQAVPGASPVDLNEDYNDVPFTTYKKDGQIRRQAARFRVFAYDQDPGGVLSNPREVVSDENTHIEWTVELCNRKAAWDRMIVDSRRRNDAVSSRDKLIVGPDRKSVAGIKQSVDAIGGSFSGHSDAAQNILLGSLRTDARGRLIVLGGHGKAYTDGTNPNFQGSFGDKDGWTDDVSDGPVTARLKIDGEWTQADPAWVVVAPPDFAPEVGQPVTLYDAGQQVASSFGVPMPSQPSFCNDILPILSRCESLRWTHDDVLWVELSAMVAGNWAGLCNNVDAETDALHREITAKLSGELPLIYTESPVRRQVQLTEVQRNALRLWAEGNFVRDFDDAPLPTLATPRDLDRGAIDHAVGAGLYPGIEVGTRMTDPSNYIEPFRLRPDLAAGFLTEQMAVPWQSDFEACSGSWWPAQRPDLAPQKSDPGGVHLGWTDGLVAGVADMVNNYTKLGYIKKFVTDSGVILAEDERVPPR